MKLSFGRIPNIALRSALAASLVVMPVSGMCAQYAFAGSAQSTTESTDLISVTADDENVAQGQSANVRLSITDAEHESWIVRVMTYDDKAEALYLPVSVDGTATADSDTEVEFTNPEATLSVNAALNITGSNRPFVVELYSGGSRPVRLSSAALNMCVLPASYSLSFDACVTADDQDQLSEASKQALKATRNVTYGREYSYDCAVSQESTALPKPTRSNYNFAGWYLNYDAKTGKYSNLVTDSTLVNVKKDVTLYAKWEGAKYTVKLDLDDKGTAYDANGNEVSSLPVVYGATYSALADITVTSNSEDEEFYGWQATDADGGTVTITSESVVSSSTAWSPDGTQTLTAVWGVPRTSIENAQVTGLSSSYGYTGEEILPEVTVTLKKDDGSTEVLVKDRDYTVSGINNIEMSSDDSKATLVIKGAGSYNGSLSREFSIVQGTPSFEQGSELTVRYGRIATNKLRTDAEVTYVSSDETIAKVVDNTTGEIAVFRAGTAVITAYAAGTEHFAATPERGLSYTVKVRGASIDQCKITLSKTTFEYDGKEHTPTVKITDPSGYELVKGKDFVMGATPGKKVGRYFVAIIGIGDDYSGTEFCEFYVTSKKPAKLKKKKIATRTVAGKKKKVNFYKITWTKVSSASGYELKRVFNKKTKKTTITNKKKNSQVIGWEAGTKVKLYVRSYKISSTGTKWYSSWKGISFKA